MERNDKLTKLLFLPLLALALHGCDDSGGGGSSGDGSLTVELEAEETITDGIQAGNGEENIVDGWTVNYDKFLVAVGNVEIGKDGDTKSSGAAYVADLTSLPTTGFELAKFDGIATGQWDQFGFEITTADKATKNEEVSPDDFDRMVTDKLTYLIQGTANKGDTSIDFEFAEAAATLFGPCQTEDGPPGFSVTDMGETTVAATIHGDHIFFSGFPSGAEIVDRRARWLEEVDTLGNGDGTVDDAELEAVTGADLETVFPTGEPATEGGAQYFLSGAPIAINSARDFVIAQLETQGHFQGEGECPWTVE